MIQGKPIYPIIICDSHPDLREPGYIVCPHILHSTAPVAFFEKADESSMGLVLCGACVTEGSAGSGDALFNKGFRCVCAHACRDQGWDKAVH